MGETHKNSLRMLRRHRACRRLRYSQRPCRDASKRPRASLCADRAAGEEAHLEQIVDEPRPNALLIQWGDDASHRAFP